MNKIIAVLLLVNSGCALLAQKVVKVHLNEGNYGWYFIFLEKDTTCSLKFIDEGINMCNVHFIYLKMDDPEKYGLHVYDCQTNEKISQKMIKTGYRGTPSKKSCFQFYYPDPNLYPNEVIQMPSYKEKKKYEKYEEISNMLTSESFRLLDSLMKEHNISW